jgi:hypothetical protein
MDNILNTKLITNEEEAKSFKTLLDSYWMETCTSYRNSETIREFYSIKENLPFIDNEINNRRAATLALSSSDPDLLNILFTSDDIKNKKYSLDALALTIGKQFHISNDCALLLIDNVENNNSAFVEYKLRTKRIFIKSCIEYFANNIDFLDEHEDYFFNFMKKYKVNPYVKESPIAQLLLENGRIKTFDRLIDLAKEDEDKERILFHTLLWTINASVEDKVENYLELKRKSFIAHKEYQALQIELKQKDNVKKPKALKV